ncbi:MAG: CDP-archaeol synthase [Geminicoccaceae bacterium]
MQQLPAIIIALALLTVANGMPVLTNRVLGRWGAWPIDGGLVFVDGQPLLGRSKTWRGVIVAVLGTSAAALALELPWHVGALAGAAAMTGDLASSFAKRRMRLAPSSMAPGVDQVPEAVLPLLACQNALSLTIAEVLVTTALFWIGVLGLSRLLYRLGIREQPY